MEQQFSGQITTPKMDGNSFGNGCVEGQINQILDQYSASKVFLVSTNSLVENGLLGRVQTLLGDRLVGGFYSSKPHTPRGVVRDAVKEASQCSPDLLISLGGSSVVDLTKAVALVLAEGDDFGNLCVRFSPTEGLVLPALAKPKLPHISIPTTLSASEYTFAVAITDEITGEKELSVDPKLTPKWTFHDGDFCRDTPAELWSSTGMKILADCIEVLGSKASKPITDAIAIGALELLMEHLPKSVENSNTSTDRMKCLSAGFMILGQAQNASLGLVAGLRHQLGGGLGISHGIGSTIVLPHVMEWSIKEAEPKYANAARKIGVATFEESNPSAAQKLVDAVRNLAAELNLPTKLSEVGATSDSFQAIAEHVKSDFAVANSPRPIQSTEDVLEVLLAAY